MKKTFFLLAAAILTFALSSCSKDDPKEPKVPGETAETSIDATSKTAWHYYSFAQGKVIGSADESEENNAAWGARKDWDIAINRYKVRTNSGVVTSVGALGGVYTFDASMTFDKVENVPANAQFVADKNVETAGMGGTTIEKRSEAYVVFVSAGDGGMKYDPTPVYIIRSADGTKYYKIFFTQYFNDEGKSGHVKFNTAQIYQQ